MKRFLLFLLLCLIASTSLTVVLCSIFTINSNPSPVGTVTHEGQTYYKLPDGQVGQTYSVVFSTTSAYPSSLRWKIYGSPPSGLAPNPPSPSVQSETLTLSGTPNAAGTFYFTVEAREDYPNGATTQTKNYVITINPSETPPPPTERIDYTLDVNVGILNKVEIDLTPLALGQSVVSKSDSYNIRLRKLGGDSEYIRLEQEGLPQGVDMWVAGTFVRAPTSLILENLWLEGELTLTMSFSVERAGNWRELAGPGGARKEHLITIRGASQSGVGRSDPFYLVFYYGMPKLQVFNLEPLTQHGSTLIVYKQTIFKFQYTLDHSSQITLDYKLDLGPRSDWIEEPEWYHSSENWYWHYGIDLREENIEGSWHLVHYGRITLEPTAEPRTAYLMENVMSGFLPRPSGSGRYDISLEIDPYGGIGWKEGSVLTTSGSFTCRQYPSERWVKIVLWEDDLSFTDSQIFEYLDRICSQVGWVDARGPYAWGSGPVYPYDVYLSGVFKDYFYTRPIAGGYRGDIGWWNADTAGEDAADEGYDRVIAIVPPGELGGSTIGVVYHYETPGVEYPYWDQGYYTAFVDFNEALDSGRYQYFPTAAHELSHTFRFPDIYDGYIIRVTEECVYFDEFNGGVIKVFKEHEVSGDMRYWDYAQGRLITMPSTSVATARDIMDFGGWDRADYWSWASWKKVGGVPREDPPEDLLISMIIFRNGTVIGRPFQKVYNHSWGWEDPEPSVTGNFSLTLYLRNGQVFKRIPYNISFYYYVDPGGRMPTDAVPFVRLVDWTDGLGRIELTGPDGKVWFTRDVSANAPVLEIIYPPDGKKLGIGRNYTLVWKGTDADGDQLWYTVLMRREGDEVWTSLASRITEDRISLESGRITLGGSEFPEGDYKIQVKATDGVNTAVKVIRVKIVEQGQIKMYSLTVGSNIGLEIEGSGTYEEGDMVKVKAPVEEPMKGFFGMLGGKYQFNRWTGVVESKDSEVVVQMTGEQTSLTLTALYDENYTQVFLILGVIVVVVLIIVILVALKLRKPKPAPPSPPPPPPS
ncbi:MAG: hypothetical protein QXF52_04260 [Thermoproteota archaeon]